MPTYYLGLDVHKVRTQYCLMDPAGEILKEGAVPTEEVAAVVPDHDSAVVLEATGSLHFAHDAFVATSALVKLAHPARVKAIASARVKTDKIDVRILAHLLRTDLIPEAWALARECLRYPGTGMFGKSGRAWLATLDLAPHTGGMVDLLLSAIDEADHEKDAPPTSSRRAGGRIDQKARGAQLMRNALGTFVRGVARDPAHHGVVSPAVSAPSHSGNDCANGSMFRVSGGGVDG